MSETVQSIIRAVLKIGGGVLVTKGVMTESALTDVTGAVITLVGVVWGIVAARKAAANKPAA